MMEYESNIPVSKNSLKRYLLDLRNNYKNRYCSKKEFCIKASIAYLKNKKPYRALALLKDEERSSLEIIKLKKQALALIKKIKHQTCSLNMIVKNEEKNIYDALESIDDIIDEIVICDTGSTDNTVFYAKLFGAEIINSKWNNDFSEARNIAIKNSSCNWILWMDADDRLDTNSSASLVNLWQNAKYHGALFNIVNTLKNSPSASFSQVRMFPRKKNIKFERKIHEQIMFSIKKSNLEFIYHNNINIIHTGYHDFKTLAKKAVRNQNIIYNELLNNENDITLRLSYADGFVTMGDYNSAIKEYLKICNNKKFYKLHPDVYIQSIINLATLLINKKSFYNAKKYLFMALRLDKQRIDAWYKLGEIYKSENKHNLALDMYFQATKIVPTIKMTAINNTKIKLDSTYYICEILLLQKRNNQAEKILTAVLLDYPMIPAFYNLLGKSYFYTAKYKKSFTAFSKSIEMCKTNNNDAWLGLIDIYLVCKNFEQADYHLKLAIKNGLTSNKIIEIYKSKIKAVALLPEYEKY